MRPFLFYPSTFLRIKDGRLRFKKKLEETFVSVVSLVWHGLRKLLTNDPVSLQTFAFL